MNSGMFANGSFCNSVNQLRGNQQYSSIIKLAIGIRSIVSDAIIKIVYRWEGRKKIK